MAGAYRCPVCGIDFPTGTPGAPNAPVSPAAIEPDQREPSDGPTSAELAARLKGALDRELALDEDQRDDERHEHQSAEVFEHDDGEDRLDSGAVPDDRAPVPQVRPGRREPVGAADLTLAPARERPGPPARTERRREKLPAAREPRRRSKAGSLAMTITVALVLLGAAGSAAVWLDLSGNASLGIVRDRLPATLRPAPTEVSVTAAEGWVTVPAGEGALTVTADGPFRVRIDGVVYSVDAGRRLRVPRTAETRVEVLAVGEGTVASVSAAP